MTRLIGLGLLACAAASAAAHPAQHRSLSVAAKAARLGPGQYVWAPNAASTGPLFLVIDLSPARLAVPQRRAHCRLHSFNRRRGRETPTGMFTILQKEVVHRSRTYDDAPMPYMQRLTWKGVAMHAGHLPGYPASHGCIRLPKGFAKRLYGVTKIGTPVMITA